MKLEKFKKYGVRNKKIVYSVIGIIVIICGVLLLKSFAFFESKYDFNVIKGRIPEFNTGDIQLAFTIDGVKSNEVFPDKESVYAAKSVTCNNGVTASWNNITWALENIEPNGNKKISCNIDFGRYLYKVVNVGDYVSYTPSNTSYTISKSLTGYSSDQTINPSELDLWQVVRKNEDGTIEMISKYVSSTNVYFYGQTGYNNFLSILNAVAKQYETNEITGTIEYPIYSIYKCEIGGVYGPYSELLKTVEIDIKAQTKAQQGTTSYTSYWSSKGEYCYYASDAWYYEVNFIDEGGLPVGRGLYFYSGVRTLGAGFRPPVLMKTGVIINSGDGSETSPYKIN